MTYPFVDTDVLIRLLSGDDPEKQARAHDLFDQVENGRLTLASPDTVVADAVFVLASPRLYRMPRDEIRAVLGTLVRLPHFRVNNRASVLRALDLYAASSALDFGDALIVASMERAGSKVVYSYDADFDRIEGITRHEP